MPIQKFGSFEEAERALWLPSGHPDCVGKWAALLALSRRMHPNRKIFKGVRRYASVFERSELDSAPESASATQSSKE